MATLNRKTEASPQANTDLRQPFYTPHESSQRMTPRFPVEKLATPRSAQEERTIPTPPPEVDDMDWTPSLQHNLQPASTVYDRDQRAAALAGPTPFYGSLPPAPTPPSWNLRGQPSQRQKPLEQVVERNPFHHSPVQPPSSWGRNADSPDPVFAPPRFFPVTDHASTGLENLFDQAFTIQSPDNDEQNWQSLHQPNPDTPSPQSSGLQAALTFQCLRTGLLFVSLVIWNASQYKFLTVPGNYIEVASLGCASLLAGFALLESLKQPIIQWNGMELLVYVAELAAAVHLGGYLPEAASERQYFDRYGKLLLVFMVVQEALGVLAIYRNSVVDKPLSSNDQQPHRPSSPRDTIIDDSPKSRVSKRSGHRSLGSPSSAAPPPLSFSSTAPGSSFGTQRLPDSQSNYQLPLSSYEPSPYTPNQNHSFSLKGLKNQDADASDPDLDRDSDTETTMTTATGTTNNTIKDIRYGRSSSPNDTFFSPKRSALGPGLGSLSLDDGPSRRMTRSQSQKNKGQTTSGFRRRGLGF